MKRSVDASDTKSDPSSRLRTLHCKPALVSATTTRWRHLSHHVTLPTTQEGKAKAEDRCRELEGIGRALEARVQAAEDALGGARAERDSMRARLSAALSALREAEETHAGRVRDLEAERDDARGRVQRLVAELEAEGRRADELKRNLEEARNAGTPRGEGAKRVSRLAFEKIKRLEESLREEQAKIEGLQAQLAAVGAEKARAEEEGRERVKALGKELERLEADMAGERAR